LKNNNIAILNVAAESQRTRFEDKYEYAQKSIKDNFEEDIKKHFEECIQFIGEFFFLPSFPLAHFAGSDGLSFVEQSRAAGKIVLIHCTAGKSRSPTIAMAYLIQQNGYFIVFLFLSQSSAHYISSRWSLRKSYDFLKRQRDISPNLGFLCSLGEFEKGFFPCFLFLSFFFPPSSQSQHEIASFVQNRNSRRQE